jgi:hypothetical protein
MNRFEFQLNISAEQYLDYYRGTIRQVVVRTHEGKTVQFPASLLQRFITKEGIHGSFALLCDQHHANARLVRLN